MLTEDQRRRLEDLIVTYVGVAPVPASLKELVGPEAARRAPPTANGFGLSNWVLNYALRLPGPDAFVTIVLTCDPAGELVDVHQLVQRLQADAKLWRRSTDPAIWVPAEWPFVNRQLLRTELMLMAAGQEPCVIAIEAPAGHGKRTVAAYIELLARTDRSFAPVLVEIRREPESQLLDTLVARVRLELGIELASGTTHEEPEREAILLARELARDAAFAPNTVWLVLNIMEVSGLDTGLLRFLDELLGLIAAMPEAARRIRVVVLANELGALPLRQVPNVNARFVLPEISDVEVQEWLAAAVPDKPQALYALATSAVFDAVVKRNPPPSKRLEWIAMHCRVAHKNLIGAPDG